jgi:hypothetical protein
MTKHPHYAFDCFEHPLTNHPTQPAIPLSGHIFQQHTRHMSSLQTESWPLQNPSWIAEGVLKMICISDTSRQPVRAAWTMEQLNAELTINLGMAIDHSTHDSYSSPHNEWD